MSTNIQIIISYKVIDGMKYQNLGYIVQMVEEFDDR